MPSHTGSVRVSANKRYFVDANDVPFFWLGDTAWPLYTYYSRAEAETYLRDRAARGFTVIQGVFAWGAPVDPQVSLEGTPPAPNPDGQLPWNESPAEPNSKFFEHTDALIELAHELGLVMAVIPTWGYHVTNSRVVNAENAYAYGYWLGQHYKHQPNLVWMNGGDRAATGFEEVFRALARGLRDGDGGAHLITYHPCGWQSSSYYFPYDAWLDFNMIETWTDWSKVYPTVLADYGLVPTRPVVLAEGAYENGPEYPRGPITPLLVRRQAWWAWMAGGFFTYGQNQMWRMEQGWLDTLDTLGARNMTTFKQIVETCRWWELIPDQTLFDHGINSGGTLNTAMRSVDRTTAIVYLSSPTHVVLCLDRIGTNRVRVKWVNPQTGAELAAGEYETGNDLTERTFPRARRQGFTTPDFWEDAVLILEGVTT